MVGALKITGRLVEAPPSGEAVVVGDLHGDLKSLVHILEESRFLGKLKKGRDVLLIFLGDYGDRGAKSPEVYYVVLTLKKLFPEHVILMRGNHEGPRDLYPSPHDLPRHLENRFGKKGSEAYLNLRELFNHLYTGVLITERYILLHGGFPSQAKTVNDIAFAHKTHPQKLHLEEILWSDPWTGIKGTIASNRGAGKLFGEDVTDRLLRMLNVKVLIRGHQSSPDGYKTDHNQKVLSLFSRKGVPYNNRYGAYLHRDLSQKIETPKQLLKGIHKF
jgi:protein phosphatase